MIFKCQKSKKRLGRLPRRLLLLFVVTAFVLRLPCVGFLRLVQAVVTMEAGAEQVLFGLTLSAAHGFDDVEGDGAGRLALLLHSGVQSAKKAPQSTMSSRT